MNLPFQLRNDKGLRESDQKIPSKALFGAELAGDNAVRFVYVDEAGTSALEPVSIVVGIIIHADNQWNLVESKVTEVLKAVPDRYQADFIFHAKTIWGSKKYHENWGRNERLALLHKMMSIPRLLKLPIALGIVRRTAPSPDNVLPSSFESLSKSLSVPEFHHQYAFWLCLCEADKFLRNYAEPNEVAIVVAENVPNMQKFLRSVLSVPELVFSRQQLSFTPREVSINPTPEFRITRIKGPIHFAEKKQDPLLQIADACAYGFRRHFAKEKLGDDFVNSIRGKRSNLRDDLPGPFSGLLIRFEDHA